MLIGKVYSGKRMKRTEESEPDIANRDMMCDSRNMKTHGNTCLDHMMLKEVTSRKLEVKL